MWFKSKKQKLKEAFSEYVPSEKIEEILAERKADLSNILEGKEKFLTISYTNMNGYVSIAEKLNLSDLKLFMDKFVFSITRNIQNHGGIVSGIVADEIFAYWGLFESKEEGATNCCLSALNQINILASQFQSWARSKGFPEPAIRIGIGSDKLIIGNIGHKNVFDFQPFGTKVIEAKRLCDEARDLNPPILIDRATKDLINNFAFGEEIEFEYLDKKMVSFQIIAPNHGIKRTGRSLA